MQTMQFKQTQVRFSGDLELETLSLMERTLRDLDAEIVVIDLSEVRSLGARALEVLVRLKKRLHNTGRLGIVRIIAPNPHMYRLFEVTGLNKMFDLCTSPADAQSRLP